MNRRQFLGGFALAAASSGMRPSDILAEPSRLPGSQNAGAKPYGSGYFGEWMTDEFGLPAFRYTCDQTMDPKAVTPLNPGILSPTEHIHQVGNDRLVAIVSNYGTVRVRQDEGAPKFLNDFAPDQRCFAGGIGWVTDGPNFLSTFYPGNAARFDRIFGAGYFRKRVSGHGLEIDQVIFAPFGDDPVLISQATVSNRGSSDAHLRWIEYWGCQIFEFSFRAFMEMFSGQGLAEMRRDFGARFGHSFRAIEGRAGLIESKTFLGFSPEEQQRWQGVLGYLEKVPNPFLTPPDEDVPKSASFDDLNPPPTFLVSLDAPAEGFSTNGAEFFGVGGANHPDGLSKPLDGNLKADGAASALLLERKVILKPGDRRTLYFLYGYLPEGANLDSLVRKYEGEYKSSWPESSRQWKNCGLHFAAGDEAWIERETVWNHFSLRSSRTFDSFFRRHIFSQGAVYQYVMGFQGAARDPLQHALPFLYSDPEILKEVLLYTLEEVRPNGSIPYGIVGHGMIMPVTSDDSSDMPMWLLWAASEYVLATRDRGFLDEPVGTLYGSSEGSATVRELLARCYRHLIEDVGTGEHGLMRMLRDDWNDGLVNAWVPQQAIAECVLKSESVLNSAMASYVFDRYAILLTDGSGDAPAVREIRKHAEEHRQAVRRQWTGEWFRRAWLGPSLGWLGEKGLWIEPQPWAIIGGAATEDQTRILIQAMDKELRDPSPIGAMQLSKSPDMAQHGVWKMAPGESVDGGVWPSLNQTLIWALARVDGAKAWNEWKKNTFARHAEVYPEVWYGTWSGPDVLNSVWSEHPGESTGGKPFGWTDFPVLNLHSHACSLFSLAKLMGLEFDETGFTLAPKLPLPSYRFDSKLFGLVKSPRAYEGWYEPLVHGSWKVRIKLEETKPGARVKVNGHASVLNPSAGDWLEFKGPGGNGKPLSWSIEI